LPVWRSVVSSSFCKLLAITSHCSPFLGMAAGSIYRLRVLTPSITTLCGVSAGIHTALCCGTTQLPCCVETSITPGAP